MMELILDSLYICILGLERLIFCKIPLFAYG